MTAAIRLGDGPVSRPFTTPEARGRLRPEAFMGKNLGGAIIDLLESDRIDLRVAATTVLAAVANGDKTVMSALTSRLGDSDVGVRRIALEGLADLNASG